jgi:hypothetical protein
LTCPKNNLSSASIVAAVVRNIPAIIGKVVNGAEDSIAVNTYSSGKNPEVPGKPTFARDAISMKKQNIGITPSRPPKAIEDLVW